MRRKIAIGIGIALLVLVFIGGGIGLYISSLLEAPVHQGEEPLKLYITKQDTPSAIADRLNANSALRYLLESEDRYRVRTGFYAIPNGESSLDVFRRLRSGNQTPVKLVIKEARTMDRIAGQIAKAVQLDSAEIAECLYNPDFCEEYGYTVETMPALFIPNTYHCYWDVTLSQLMERLKRENDNFWTAERDMKASLLNMTHNEVSTLASIVESETANNAEKPRVAGLYLNRLRLHMKLQADPTVIFAVGDFSIRRVLNEHLRTESPYNTYLHEGLPPGPIRIPSIDGLDAVLNAEQHSYLYMCAKEDFSGTHNFATSWTEHIANARRYQRALSERGIQK